MLKAAGVADTGQHVPQPLLVPHLPTPHGCGESTAERRIRGEKWPRKCSAAVPVMRLEGRPEGTAEGGREKRSDSRQN